MSATDFPAGRRFRVRIPLGARSPVLIGFRAIVGGQQSATLTLAEGDVIICAGQHWGWGGDPGLEIFFEDPRDPDIARRDRLSYIHFFPTTGHWMAAEPDMRYLEAFVD